MARPKRARKEPERLIDAAPAKKAIAKKAPAKKKQAAAAQPKKAKPKKPKKAEAEGAVAVEGEESTDAPE